MKTKCCPIDLTNMTQSLLFLKAISAKIEPFQIDFRPVSTTAEGSCAAKVAWVVARPWAQEQALRS